MSNTPGTVIDVPGFAFGLVRQAGAVTRLLLGSTGSVMEGWGSVLVIRGATRLYCGQIRGNKGFGYGVVHNVDCDELYEVCSSQISSYIMDALSSGDIHVIDGTAGPVYVRVAAGTRNSAAQRRIDTGGPIQRRQSARTCRTNRRSRSQIRRP